MKKLISVLTSFALLHPLSVLANGSEAWYVPAADFCVGRGYMENGEGGGFDPDAAVTRGELAIMIHALDNSPSYEFDDPEIEPDYPFDDLERGQRFTDAAVWGESVGIFAGCGDSVFGGEREVTREQAAVVLRAFAAYRQYDISKRASLDRFPDADRVSAWAREAVEWCVENGLIAGALNNGALTISPRAKVTRAQIAAIIRSFRLNLMDKAFAGASQGSYFLMGGDGGGSSNDDSPVFDEILRVARNERPSFLYVGLAGGPGAGEEGAAWLQGVFGDRGASYGHLEISDFDDPAAGREKIMNADVIYVGGGSSVKLVERLRGVGALSVLREAAANGTVMAGTSAGAICFCDSGLSQVGNFHMRVDAAGCLDLLMCPHALTDPARYALIEKELGNTKYMKCVALDGAALEIHGGRFRAIITDYDGYTARICEYGDGGYATSGIGAEWRPLSELTG